MIPPEVFGKARERMDCKGKLVVVSGSAGSGKSTVLRNFKLGLCDPFRFSVSATTRTPRHGEVEGVDYFFVSREAFERMIRRGELLEHAFFNHHYYGTPKAAVERLMQDGYTVILEIETDGALQVLRLYGDAVSIFLSPPDYATLERRLRARGSNTEEDIRDRLERARAEIEYARRYRYMLVNLDNRMDDVTSTITALLTGETTPNPEILVRDKDTFISRFFLSREPSV